MWLTNNVLLYRNWPIVCPGWLANSNLYIDKNHLYTTTKWWGSLQSSDSCGNLQWTSLHFATGVTTFCHRSHYIVTLAHHFVLRFWDSGSTIALILKLIFEFTGMLEWNAGMERWKGMLEWKVERWLEHCERTSHVFFPSLVILPQKIATKCKKGQEEGLAIMETRFPFCIVWIALISSQYRINYYSETSLSDPSEKRPTSLERPTRLPPTELTSIKTM